jgi:hypothetical protein
MMLLICQVCSRDKYFCIRALKHPYDSSALWGNVPSPASSAPDIAGLFAEMVGPSPVMSGPEERALHCMSQGYRCCRSKGKKDAFNSALTIAWQRVQDLGAGSVS